ncbi:hypothetical protein [Burkholderia ubonensis]|uniref:hypothetical protein n=1 Tax=Burkholderia ubonensis TaxID=101571 RepID=UPI000A9BC096|nr:hypothetical protein [Burkholderia ubonensis]
MSVSDLDIQNVTNAYRVLSESRKVVDSFKYSVPQISSSLDAEIINFQKNMKGISADSVSLVVGNLAEFFDGASQKYSALQDAMFNIGSMIKNLAVNGDIVSIRSYVGDALDGSNKIIQYWRSGVTDKLVGSSVNLVSLCAGRQADSNKLMNDLKKEALLGDNGKLKAEIDGLRAQRDSIWIFDISKSGLDVAGEQQCSINYDLTEIGSEGSFESPGAVVGTVLALLVGVLAIEAALFIEQKTAVEKMNGLLKDINSKEKQICNNSVRYFAGDMLSTRLSDFYKSANAIKDGALKYKNGAIEFFSKLYAALDGFKRIVYGEGLNDQGSVDRVKNGWNQLYSQFHQDMSDIFLRNEVGYAVSNSTFKSVNS